MPRGAAATRGTRRDRRARLLLGGRRRPRDRAVQRLGEDRPPRARARRLARGPRHGPAHRGGRVGRGARTPDPRRGRRRGRRRLGAALRGGRHRRGSGSSGRRAGGWSPMLLGRRAAPPPAASRSASSRAPRAPSSRGSRQASSTSPSSRSPCRSTRSRTTPLFDEDLVLVVPAGHPLTRVPCARSSSTQLADLDLLLPLTGTALRDELDDAAAVAGVELLRARSSSTACAPSPRSPSTATGLRSCPRPRCPATCAIGSPRAGRAGSVAATSASPCGATASRRRRRVPSARMLEELVAVGPLPRGAARGPRSLSRRGASCTTRRRRRAPRRATQRRRPRRGGPPRAPTAAGTGPPATTIPASAVRCTPSAQRSGRPSTHER